MNTIHHFGDSYGTIYNDKYVFGSGQNYAVHFVEMCSHELKKNYFNYSIPGVSNEIILKILIENISKFKYNDIVFIQFSYFSRGTYYDEDTKKIRSTNYLYSETENVKAFERANNNEKLLSLVKYYLTHTEDYNRRIFEIFDVLINQLCNMGIFVYFIHIDDSNYTDSLLNNGFNIKFEKGFGKWLQYNNFHNEEEGHYSKHIQTMLSKMIIDVTNNFNIRENGISDIIKFSDFDKTLIGKNKKTII